MYFTQKAPQRASEAWYHM